MKLASIVPVQNIERTFDGEYAMMLTHLMNCYPARKEIDHPCYRILDNSLIELGGAVSLDRLLEAAEQCEADEIILPDVFLDAHATLSSVYDSLEGLDRLGLLHKYRLMAVCQGETPSQFEYCFRMLESLKDIHCIGIPKVAAKIHLHGRPGFEYLWQGSPKAIHLLGCWYNLSEFREYVHPECIRSADTCIPALNAMSGKRTWETRVEDHTIDLIHDDLTPHMAEYEKILETLKGEHLL